VCVHTIAVEANDRVSKVSIETHARSEGNGQIGKQAHAEGGKSRNSSCCCDQIPLDFLNALQIHQWAVSQTVVRALRRADAVAAAVGDDTRLDMLILLKLTIVVAMNYS
jgi:hypothetical protein